MAVLAMSGTFIFSQSRENKLTGIKFLDGVITVGDGPQYIGDAHFSDKLLDRSVVFYNQAVTMRLSVACGGAFDIVTVIGIVCRPLL